MKQTMKQPSPFSLEGRFLGFEIEDGYKIKRLHLANAEGEYCIKLSKVARASVKGVLRPGEWLHVFGEQTLKDGSIRYKAYLIRPVPQAPRQPPGAASDAPPMSPFQPRGCQSAPVSSADPTSPRKTAAAQATILMCQKSDCMKRGGKAVCQALQQTLRDRNLDHQVVIKGTGCMKQCKAGPNLVMPNKQRYSKIRAAEIPTLIEQHFPAIASAPPSTVSPPSPAAESRTLPQPVGPAAAVQPFSALPSNVVTLC
jgi:(2Fe-2S) ferredoxin